MFSRPPALSSGRRIRPFFQHAHRIVPSCLHHVLVSLDRTWRVHTTAMHVTGAGGRPSLTTSHVTARSTTFVALGSGRWMRVGSGRIKAKGRVTTSHKKKKTETSDACFHNSVLLLLQPPKTFRQHLTILKGGHNETCRRKQSTRGKKVQRKALKDNRNDKRSERMRKGGVKEGLKKYHLRQTNLLPTCRVITLFMNEVTAYPDDTARDEGEVRTHAPQSSRSW